MQQDKITEILTADLPKEALKPLPHKRNAKGQPMTSITPIYVIERLNKAFGLGGWQFEPEVINDEEKMVIIRGVLTAPSHNIRIVQFGGNDNRDKGDAYKGATTDALIKCASYLGVGAHVWRDGQPSEVIKTPEDEKKIRADFEKRIKGKTKDVNAWLKSIKMIESDQSHKDLKLKQIEEFLANWEAFTKQVNKQNESSQSKTTK